jgi:hypothetical protein
LPNELPPLEVGTADGGTIEVPRSGVYIGNISPGKVSTRWAHSLERLVDFDRTQRLGLHRGTLYQESNANISKGRNELVTQFLGTDDGEWLLLLDSDMVFPPEVIVRLLAASVVTGSLMVGGLCVFIGNLGPIPTLYQYRTADAITGVQFDYPDGAQLQVAATGSACLMVHRSVFEAYQAKMRADQEWLLDLRQTENPTLMELIDRDLVRDPSVDYGWFQERVRIKRTETIDGVKVSEHWMGEDIDFCLRMGDVGFSTYVDCTLEIGHAKHGRIWYPRDIRDGVGIPRAPVVAVVPVKNRLDLTTSLIGQLREQGGATEIVVCDNGSTRPTKNWLGSQDDLTVLDMPDAGIHDMWNAGIEHALEKHGPRTHLAFLNNDLELGPAFLRTLSQALTDNRELVAVCGNYDNRGSNVPVVLTTDICANRYNGEGGFAGFAFMVRGEWFGTGYRFPAECKWWFGDNDLMRSIARADTHRGYDDRPSKAGIVIAARVNHLDGGGGTAGDVMWSKHQAQIDLDREAFDAKWAQIYQTDADTERVKAGDFEPLYRKLTSDEDNAHLAVLRDLVVDEGAKTVALAGLGNGATCVALLMGLNETDGHLWGLDAKAHGPSVATHPRVTLGNDLPVSVDLAVIDFEAWPQLTAADAGLIASRIKPGGVLAVRPGPGSVDLDETFQHVATRGGLTIERRLAPDPHQPTEGARICVLSCNFGGHDVVSPLPAQDIECDAVLLTNKPCDVPGWRNVVVPIPDEIRPRMWAKRPRCQPEKFTDAETVVWFDAHLEVRSTSLVRELVDQLGDGAFGAFRHGFHTSISQEAALASTLPKYEGYDLVAQAKHYLEEGHPDSWGMWTTGVMVRRPAATVEFGEAWLAEIEQWGPEDQISLPYVLRTTGTEMVDLPFEGWWTGERFILHPHNDGTM